ncbi:MAG: cell division protein ZapA [Oscillospiraceae bacterium]|nr:cell division protein ZapA [Oscillospiraceae bacterium]
MKNKITVELCDKEYSLLWDETEDYVKSLASDINKMIDNMAYNNLRISKADAAVLTCLDLCDKNKKLIDDNDNMRRQIMMHVDEIAMLNKKLAAFERQKSSKGLKNLGADEENDINEDGFENIAQNQQPNA